MKIFTSYNRCYFIIALLLSGVFLLSQCVNREPLTSEVIQNFEGQAFSGSASCAGCHKELYDDHLHTAHFLTSQPGTAEYVKGSFHSDSNTFNFSPNVLVRMEKRNDGFYQAEYRNNEEVMAKKMDIVVGSGTMGQSSLYWRDNYLFQLPITYFSAANQWSNSPGFPNRVVFNRIITSRCMECHSTFMSTISEPGKEPEKFDRNKIIYGVDCEKCHGPAAEHVNFHKEHPADSNGKFIINPASFTRQQKLELCALCHGGRLQKTQPSFTFTAGDALSDHFIIDTSMPDPNRIDVHGNQYGLMRASKCFKASDVLTCNSCHDVHKNEKGKTALYSERCMSCHNEQHAGFCPMQKKVGKSITENCIDCHMPLKSSRAIAVFLPGKASPTAAKIRSHYIAVYPEESEKILEMIRSLK